MWNCPRQRPREYTIASSPAATPKKITLCVPWCDAKESLRETKVSLTSHNANLKSFSEPLGGCSGTDFHPGNWSLPAAFQLRPLPQKSFEGRPWPAVTSLVCALAGSRQSFEKAQLKKALLKLIAIYCSRKVAVGNAVLSHGLWRACPLNPSIKYGWCLAEHGWKTDSMGLKFESKLSQGSALLLSLQDWI